MRTASVALLGLFALANSAPAATGADRDIIRQFGMLGRLAVNCSAPAGRDNPHLIYAISPQGAVTRTLRMDPDLDGTFPMRNLRMLGSDAMRYDEKGRQSELTITVVKIGSKFRSWRSVRADGTILIEDGKFANSGQPTVAFENCGN